MNGMVLLLTNEAIFLGYLGFCIALAFRRAKASLAMLFSLAALATAIWGQASALVSFGLVPFWLYQVSTTIRDAMWAMTCFGLLRQRIQGRYWYALLTFSVVLALCEIAFESGMATEPMLAGVHLDATLTRLLSSLFCALLVENVLRNASRGQVWALKHWAIGLLVILASELMYRVPEFLTHIAAARLELASHLAFLVALPFLVVSSTRLPQISLKVHSSRSFVFHTATIIGAGILLQAVAFSAWYVRAYGGSEATAIQVLVAFGGCASIAALMVSGSIRSRVRRFIEQNFFSLKYDYRLEWEKVIRGLSQDPDLALGKRILAVLCNLMDSPGGVVWLWWESWNQFLPQGSMGTVRSPIPFAANAACVKLLHELGDSFLLLDGQAAAPQGQAHRDLAAGVDSAWLAVPLRHRGQLLGFAVLQHPRAPRKLGWEEENLLRLVALQVAAHVMQEETAQSLADARQLEDFNRRFAFIVHDIKNTIGQLSLLVKNIALYGAQQEFRDDMVVTLGHAVEKLENLLKSLTTIGSTPRGGTLQDVDIIEFLSRYANDQRQIGHTVLFKEPPSNTSIIKTDSTMLRTIIDHVFSNAVEASDDEAVELEISAEGNMINITISDKGPGMTEQFIREELFRMLRTSKRGGFGIGAYQVRELARDLGGDIKVFSVVGSGTAVTLSLPIQRAAGTA